MIDKRLEHDSTLSVIHDRYFRQLKPLVRARHMVEAAYPNLQ